MTGCLYGIGVGPGDPGLLTVKAVEKLKECPVIALPQEDREHCTAYQIAVLAVPELAGRRTIFLPMPMTKDREKLRESHEAAAKKVAECLENGEDTAFITLGDATVYSTFLYVQELVKQKGYRTEIISGIPSFCAAAARLNMPLVNGAQQLHLIPASYQIEEALKLPGVKVLMKAGRQMKAVKKLLADGAYTVQMVENCGMEQEKIYRSLAEIPDDAGYYSLLIVKDREEN